MFTNKITRGVPGNPVAKYFKPANCVKPTLLSTIHIFLFFTHKNESSSKSTSPIISYNLITSICKLSTRLEHKLER